MIWANLLHLGFNMWADRDDGDPRHAHITARPYLRFDEGLWRDLLRRMAGAGMNMVVLDLGEGVRYESHPELAVEGSWAPARLREELARARDLGIEPIPKLNFSTAHDAWLGEVGRMVSTPRYYAVCADLIAEVTELFDGPRLFHLGMDEESCEHQRHYAFLVVRQHELWWHDLRLLCERVERAGARPWVWSDYLWRHPEAFWANMPRTVLQSNWHYGAQFGVGDDAEGGEAPRAYLELERHGYDQVPTGSNWATPVNFERTVEFCRGHVGPERLLGFMTAPWYPTLEEHRARHEAAIDQVAAAREGLAL
ncbi:MAG: Tat pathway signal protein [Chthonomonadales bacterium]|nr:Tat pathway signal protein [Chthonomonadales bacterium]